MLIIRRKEGESILIGDEIEIQVVEVSGSRVRIGIRAPDRVLILRKEIQEIVRQNQASAARFPSERLMTVVSQMRAALADKKPAAAKNLS